MGVEDEDRKVSWMEDAENVTNKHAFEEEFLILI
jgi:pre-mRNA-processing factor 6